MKKAYPVLATNFKSRTQLLKTIFHVFELMRLNAEFYADFKSVEKVEKDLSQISYNLTNFYDQESN
jgi:hypothetical protein